jgi:hypothetical protein
MKRTYEAPALDEFGDVAQLTAALGAPIRPDVSEFPGIPSGQGSFDICRNNQPGMPC